MSKYLVIVESPAKCRTIKKYLGSDYDVEASVGHIRDLPPSRLGVDIESDFTPEYITIKGKEKIIRELKKAAKDKETVFLGPDPDREGEAIAWHIRESIKGKGGKGPKFVRVLFNEITRRGVTSAMKQPLELDLKKFESQQARRILDRLVGYQISPLLWEKVKRGLSAGRVQSVAVRLISAREEEINAFVPVEYWKINTALAGPQPPTFAAVLIKKDGKKVEIPDEKTAKEFKKEILAQKLTITSIRKAESKRSPLPPFITSTLQQEAYRKLKFTAKKTMSLAQRLYEGIDLGEEEAEGLITYMRTDSTRLSPDAVNDVRSYIKSKYGDDYLPEAPVFYKSKRRTQDAHEAIRPTNLTHDPQAVKPHLERDMFRLYDLIWKRFVACQMSKAIFDLTSLGISAGPYLFETKGEVERFAGWHKVYVEGQEIVQERELPKGSIPDLAEGNELTIVDINLKQNFTRPRPRYTESLLIKELEDKGIGRPSTYAAIISTIQDKKYVRKEAGYFHPTTLGIAVTKLLVEAFPEILSADFTSQMEEGLDRIEEGEGDWIDLLKNFYGDFVVALANAKATMKNIKVEGQETDLKCPKSEHPLVIKWGRNGEFLACSGYPDCKFTSNFKRNEDGSIEMITDLPTDKVCQKCGKPMVIKNGRYGPFYACTGYPECKSVESITIMPCPKDGCKGKITQRRTKRGRTFYGCTAYPECDFASWDKPVAEKCPVCDSPYLVEKYIKTANQNELRCPEKGCDYQHSIEETVLDEKSEQADEQVEDKDQDDSSA